MTHFEANIDIVEQRVTEYTQQFSALGELNCVLFPGHTSTIDMNEIVEGANGLLAYIIPVLSVNLDPADGEPLDSGTGEVVAVKNAASLDETEFAVLLGSTDATDEQCDGLWRIRDDSNQPEARSAIIIAGPRDAVVNNRFDSDQIIIRTSTANPSQPVYFSAQKTSTVEPHELFVDGRPITPKTKKKMVHLGSLIIQQRICRVNAATSRSITTASLMPALGILKPCKA